MILGLAGVTGVDDSVDSTMSGPPGWLFLIKSFGISGVEGANGLEVVVGLGAAGANGLLPGAKGAAGVEGTVDGAGFDGAKGEAGGLTDPLPGAKGEGAGEGVDGAGAAGGRACCEGLRAGRAATRNSS